MAEPTTHRLEPDPDAQQLGEALVDATDVQETILAETISTSGDGRLRESGRTACGSKDNLRAPLERFPSAVELAGCPRAATGIWHTHPSEKGLTNPEHSLPDWANVVFHDVDASLVVGTQQSELVVAAADPAAMVAAFQNAIGLEATHTNEVVEAIQDGRIRDPTGTRRRVREAMAPLVSTHQTPHDGLEGSLSDLEIPARDAEPVRVCGAAQTVHRHQDPGREIDSPLEHDTGRRSLALHRRAAQCQPVVRQTASEATSGVDIRGIVVGTVVGNIAGTLTNKILFGG